VLSGFATFLATQRKDYGQAEKLYDTALARDSTNANALGSFALFQASKKMEYGKAEELYKKALAADPNHLTNGVNYAEFLLLHRTIPSLRSYLAEFAPVRNLRDRIQTGYTAPFLWIAGVVSVSDATRLPIILGALKQLLVDPAYATNFVFEELIDWTKNNIQPLEEAEFWIKLADVCGGKAMASSLDSFLRWQQLPTVSLDDGLIAVGPTAA
jgi:tetratricopeptide (TPR) repeat protein